MGKDWALYETLLDHWDEIVGKEYAQSITPVKIVFPYGKKAKEKWASGHREGGILTLALPQGLAMEFSFLSPTILARINGFFGYPAFAKIALQGRYDTPARTDSMRPPQPSGNKASPAPDPRIAAQTEGIEDPELRNALASLGSSIAQNINNRQ